MFRAITTRKRASALSTALFLIGIAILSFMDSWWPGIMLVIGLPLALRQYLLGRFHDMIVSLSVFGGFYIIAQFDVPWRILVPIILVIAALYIITREFLESFQETEAEEEEDIQHEIEEKKKKK